MKQGTKMVVWGLGLGLSLLVMKIGFCIPNHFFGVAIILMICAGASEMSMAQWASAFAESALGLTKSVGDLAGPCLFAITMGIARVLYGKFGDKIDLTKFMQVGSSLCIELSFCWSVCNADFGVDWMYHMWLLSWYYVARKYQHYCSEDSKRRYSLVCTAGCSRRYGWCFGSEYGGIFFAAGRR